MGVDLRHPFLLGLAVAQRFVRSGCVCADQFLQPRAAFLICVRGEGEGESDLRKLSAGPRGRLAAVIFVPSLNRMILSAKVVVQRKRGSGTGRWVRGPLDDANRGNLDQSGLFSLLSPRLSTGHVIILPLWVHIKSFLRNQDRERRGVWGVGFR